MKNLKTFGKALYEIRISKDISLEKISEITKIEKFCFEEFEKGNFSIKSYVYNRLFLREYIKCIDISKTEEILDKFSKIYNGKSKQTTLTFVPTNNKEDSSILDFEENILEYKNYSPQKIAIIIITFLVIIFIFWAAQELSNPS